LEAPQKFIWDVGNLPFIFRPLPSPSNGQGIPDVLPFKITADTTTGVLTQAADNTVKQCLDRAYQAGSVITGLMEDKGIGKDYADDFINFITKTIGSPSCLRDKRILEIGCGSGYLLHRLKLLGGTVIGLEPGPHGQVGAQKYQVPIIQDSFPSKQLTGRFDIILLYCVLEHLEAPHDFLSRVKEHLNPHGHLLIAVEDEEPYIEHGDISIFFHEHFSYFTKKTLTNTLNIAGYDNSQILQPSFSKLLYASSQNLTSGQPAATLDLHKILSATKQFQKKATELTQEMAQRLTVARAQNTTVGIYVPGRIVNTLALTGVPLDHIRFFDDNPMLHNTYFPGINIPIESRTQLIQNPPDQIFIMSNSFGVKIAQQIKPLLPTTTVVLSWNEIFAH